MLLRIRLWTISLCALLASCQPGLHTPAPDFYPPKLEQARRLVEQPDYHGAADLLLELTREAPEQPQAWQLLAGVYDLDNTPRDAMETFRSGLSKVAPSQQGYAELALQSALLCVRRPELECSPEDSLQRLDANDPRRILVAAAIELQEGSGVKALRQLNALIEQKPPRAIAAELYYLAALTYQQLGERRYVNESLFHAVNFSSDPIMVQRIERLWKPDR